MLGKSALIILFFCGFTTVAQKNPWLFPIKPGQINAISGSVGELRNTHFHTGLDIKTEGVTGLPVYSSMNGYISRISVSPGGYGHALYVKHPNGFTTVYAHLDKFEEPIFSHVRSQQYAKQRFAISLYPKKDQFPVKKGEVIGYSGNSGSSAGPHLHWDMRDPYQRPVNSLKYSFAEIRDTTPPYIIRVAFRTMDINSTINGEFGRFEFPVVKNSSEYELSVPVNLKGNIGIEIFAYDKLDDSYNSCGISEFTISTDGQKIFNTNIEKLSFSRQRSIYTYYSYTTQMMEGNKFAKLYIDDGNNLSFYESSPGKGILNFPENDEIEYLIELKDSYSNTTNLRFKNSPSSSRGNNISHAPGITVDGNIMRFVSFTADNELDAELELEMENGDVKKVPVHSRGFHKSVFLYNMKQGVPIALRINDQRIETHFKKAIIPGKSYKYYGEKIDINFRDNSLFDTLYLANTYSHIDSIQKEEFSIINTNDPLKGSVTITLKPSEKYNSAIHSVYSVTHSGTLNYIGGLWDNDKISFNTASLGSYTIAADTVGPTIKPIRESSSGIRYRIYDDRSGIETIKASVNNEWLLMYFDPKNNVIWSEKLDPSSTISGNVLLEITDYQGNKSQYKTTIE